MSRNFAPRLLFLPFLTIFCLLPVQAFAASEIVVGRAANNDLPSTVAKDAALLDKLQYEAFLSMWEGGDPDSGMAMEAQGGESRGLSAVGGTGFGIAAIVVAVDRGWISREEGLERIMKTLVFLRDKTPRREYHGAFAHWIDSRTGKSIAFSEKDKGADIVETSFLIQGILIARAYFNGPGNEAELRRVVTKMWEEVDWDWFTGGQEDGLHWHYSPEHGHSGLKIRGYNECLITYILALGSPTHPISEASYKQWTTGDGYKPKRVYGYEIEASLNGAGPLFLAHYSFIGLDPRRMSDSFVPGGYFVRNIKHTLSNREYCLDFAPAWNGYFDGFWGLTASRVKGGYAANEPAKDSGTIAPTAALSSMPYTPHYSMQVLETLAGTFDEELAAKLPQEKWGYFAMLPSPMWGEFGPYDAVSLREKWVSSEYLAIDQLPIVCMVENYRSGLLWNLLMSDPDVQRGLARAGITEPEFEQGFPEVVVTLKREKRKFIADAVDLRRHPDTALYTVPFWKDEAGKVRFYIFAPGKKLLKTWEVDSVKGRNILGFSQIPLPSEIGEPDKSDDILELIMHDPDGREHTLPIRLH